MKKTIKIIIPIFLLPVILYALFIAEESIRLSHNKLSKALSVFNETYSGPNGDITYQSLGFKLKNTYGCPNSKDLCYVIGQTFYLTDNFILWAWIS